MASTYSGLVADWANDNARVSRNIHSKQSKKATSARQYTPDSHVALDVVVAFGSTLERIHHSQTILEAKQREQDDKNKLEQEAKQKAAQLELNLKQNADFAVDLVEGPAHAALQNKDRAAALAETVALRIAAKEAEEAAEEAKEAAGSDATDSNIEGQDSASQERDNGVPGNIQDQDNGPAWPSQDQDNGPAWPSQDQDNGPAWPSQDQDKGTPWDTQDQGKGTPWDTQDQGNEASTAADAPFKATELEGPKSNSGLPIVVVFNNTIAQRRLKPNAKLKDEDGNKVAKPVADNYANQREFRIAQIRHYDPKFMTTEPSGPQLYATLELDWASEHLAKLIIHLKQRFPFTTADGEEGEVLRKARIEISHVNIEDIGGTFINGDDELAVARGVSSLKDLSSLKNYPGINRIQLGQEMADSLCEVQIMCKGGKDNIFGTGMFLDDYGYAPHDEIFKGIRAHLMQDQYIIRALISKCSLAFYRRFAAWLAKVKDEKLTPLIDASWPAGNRNPKISPKTMLPLSELPMHCQKVVRNYHSENEFFTVELIKDYSEQQYLDTLCEPIDMFGARFMTFPGSGPGMQLVALINPVDIFRDDTTGDSNFQANCLGNIGDGDRITMQIDVINKALGQEVEWTGKKLEYWPYARPLEVAFLINSPKVVVEDVVAEVEEILEVSETLMTSPFPTDVPATSPDAKDASSTSPDTKDASKSVSDTKDASSTSPDAKDASKSDSDAKDASSTSQDAKDASKSDPSLEEIAKTSQDQELGIQDVEDNGKSSEQIEVVSENKIVITVEDATPVDDNKKKGEQGEEFEIPAELEGEPASIDDFKSDKDPQDKVNDFETTEAAQDFADGEDSDEYEDESVDFILESTPRARAKRVHAKVDLATLERSLIDTNLFGTPEEVKYLLDTTEATRVSISRETDAIRKKRLCRVYRTLRSKLFDENEARQWKSTGPLKQVLLGNHYEGIETIDAYEDVPGDAMDDTFFTAEQKGLLEYMTSLIFGLAIISGFPGTGKTIAGIHLLKPYWRASKMNPEQKMPILIGSPINETCDRLVHDVIRIFSEGSDEVPNVLRMYTTATTKAFAHKEFTHEERKGARDEAAFAQWGEAMQRDGRAAVAIFNQLRDSSKQDIAGIRDKRVKLDMVHHSVGGKVMKEAGITDPSIIPTEEVLMDLYAAFQSLESDKQKSIKTGCAVDSDKAKLYGKLFAEACKYIIANADVIVGTLCVINDPLLTSTYKPHVIFIDEASKAPSTDLWGVIGNYHGIRRVIIMVGDPLQTRPRAQAPATVDPYFENVGYPAFVRFLDSGFKHYQLRQTMRFCPPIVAVLSPIFTNGAMVVAEKKKKLEEASNGFFQARRDAIATAIHPCLKGHAIVAISVADTREMSIGVHETKINHKAAVRTWQVYYKAMAQVQGTKYQVEPGQTGIIFPYTGQLKVHRNIRDREIDRLTRQGKTFFGYPPESMKQICLETIDKFQGGSKFMMFLDCVSTAAIGDLQMSEKLFVALSRAEEFCGIIIDWAQLKACGHSNLASLKLYQLMTMLQEIGAFVNLQISTPVEASIFYAHIAAGRKLMDSADIYEQEGEAAALMNDFMIEQANAAGVQLAIEASKQINPSADPKQSAPSTAASAPTPSTAPPTSNTVETPASSAPKAIETLASPTPEATETPASSAPKAIETLALPTPKATETLASTSSKATKTTDSTSPKATKTARYKITNGMRRKMLGTGHKARESRRMLRKMLRESGQLALLAALNAEFDSGESERIIEALDAEPIEDILTDVDSEDDAYDPARAGNVEDIIADA